MNREIALSLVLALPLGMALACETPSGSRERGDACECRSDCQADLYCADSQGNLVPREEDGAFGGICSGNGTCVPRKGKGNACGDALPCSDGLVCLAAEPRHCDVAQPQGTACGAPGDCEDGLICNTAIDPPVCSTLGAVGDPCTEDTSCQIDLVCNRGYEPGHCEQPNGGTNGAPCSADANCEAGLLCHDTSYCEPIGTDGGAYHAGMSTCAAAGSVQSGEPCQQDAECATGSCVESTVGICTNHNCM